MNGEVMAPLGEVGEVWLRGPNIMKEYWRDPGTGFNIITMHSEC